MCVTKILRGHAFPLTPRLYSQDVYNVVSSLAQVLILHRLHSFLSVTRAYLLLAASFSHSLSYVLGEELKPEECGEHRALPVFAVGCTGEFPGSGPHC